MTTFDVGFSLDDPHVCGVGFNGQLSGGTPTYTVSYVLVGATTVNLSPFTVLTAGSYQSPAGYLDAVPDGTYSVTVTASDGVGTTVVRPSLFAATIGSCDPAPSPTAVLGTGATALQYPGPFGNSTSDAAGNSFATPVVTVPAGGQSPPLATTGSNAPLPTTISILLITLGGVLMVASRREDGHVS